jgi:hypothetical protein
MEPMAFLTKLLKAIAKLFVIIVTIVVLMQGYILWSIIPTTSVSSYNSVMSGKWTRADLVRHFPKSIPANAKGTQFFYRPGYLQGGSSIELRIAMPPKFIKAEIDKFEKSPKLVIHGAIGAKMVKAKIGELQKGMFYTYTREEISTNDLGILLPQDFDNYLLRSKPYKTKPISWNHGESAGVSISSKRNEIIYWAEDW